MHANSILFFILLLLSFHLAWFTHSCLHVRKAHLPVTTLQNKNINGLTPEKYSVAYMMQLYSPICYAEACLLRINFWVLLSLFFFQKNSRPFLFLPLFTFTFIRLNPVILLKVLGSHNHLIFYAKPSSPPSLLRSLDLSHHRSCTMS